MIIWSNKSFVQRINKLMNWHDKQLVMHVMTSHSPTGSRLGHPGCHIQLGTMVCYSTLKKKSFDSISWTPASLNTSNKLGQTNSSFASISPFDLLAMRFRLCLSSLYGTKNWVEKTFGSILWIPIRDLQCLGSTVELQHRTANAIRMFENFEVDIQ